MHICIYVLTLQYKGRQGPANSPSPSPQPEPEPTARAHSPSPKRLLFAPRPPAPSPRPPAPGPRPPAPGRQPPAPGPRPPAPVPRPLAHNPHPENVVTKIEVRHEFNFVTKIQPRHENSTSSRRSCVQKKKTLESYLRNHMCKTVQQTFLQPLQSYALLALI